MFSVFMCVCGSTVSIEIRAEDRVFASDSGSFLDPLV